MTLADATTTPVPAPVPAPADRAPMSSAQAAPAAASATDRSADARLARYLADQVRTATPVQRLLMLFDQLRRDLLRAEAAFGGTDLKEISDHLVHAQEVIQALRDPLDPETELGRALRGVYGFCLEHLVQANLRKDPTMVPAVRQIVERIAEANRTAAAECAAAPEAARAR